jgi:hypothetical protein
MHVFWQNPYGSHPFYLQVDQGERATLDYLALCLGIGKTHKHGLFRWSFAVDGDVDCS